MPPEIEEPPVVDVKKLGEQFFSGLKTDLNHGVAKPAPADDKEKEEANRIAEEEKQKQQQQKKPDDGLDFVAPPAKKQAQTREESIAALRKKADEEANKNKAFTEVFGEISPTAIKPVIDYVSTLIEGPITLEAVNEILTNHKGLKEENEKLLIQLQEKEKKVNELDIRYSDEFATDYQKPYEEALETLFLEFAQVGEDRNIVGPKSTTKLNEFIVSLNGKDIDAKIVKSALNVFAKEYKEETGEDAVIPSIAAMMTSIRTFDGKRNKLREAYENWSVKKKESEQQRLVESERSQSEREKALERERKSLASKAYNTFNFDEVPFLDPVEAQTFFREEYQFGEEIRQGKVPPYDDFIKRGVESRLWNKWKGKIAELIKLEEKLEESERSGLPGSDTIDNKNKGQKTDWLNDPIRSTV